MRTTKYHIDGFFFSSWTVCLWVSADQFTRVINLIIIKACLIVFFAFARSLQADNTNIRCDSSADRLINRNLFACSLLRLNHKYFDRFSFSVNTNRWVCNFHTRFTQFTLQLQCLHFRELRFLSVLRKELRLFYFLKLLFINIYSPLKFHILQCFGQLLLWFPPFSSRVSVFVSGFFQFFNGFWRTAAQVFEKWKKKRNYGIYSERRSKKYEGF